MTCCAAWRHSAAHQRKPAAQRGQQPPVPRLSGSDPATVERIVRGPTQAAVPASPAHHRTVVRRMTTWPALGCARARHCAKPAENRAFARPGHRTGRETYRLDGARGRIETMVHGVSDAVSPATHAGTTNVLPAHGQADEDLHPQRNQRRGAVTGTPARTACHPRSYRTANKCRSPRSGSTILRNVWVDLLVRQGGELRTHAERQAGSGKCYMNSDRIAAHECSQQR